MNYTCEKCPQYKRVCDGIKSNERYCFFEHGNAKTTLSRDILDLMIKVTNECLEKYMMRHMVKLGQYELKEYGSDNYYLLSVQNKKDNSKYPIGYIIDRKEK